MEKELEFKIPDHIDIYFKNWLSGYNFGLRDARLGTEVNNFTTEPHGFMGGYILGYGNALEKLKGVTSQHEFYNGFLHKLRTREILFTPRDENGNEIGFSDWLKTHKV